jgi:hypothetical protein
MEPADRDARGNAPGKAVDAAEMAAGTSEGTSAGRSVTPSAGAVIIGGEYVYDSDVTALDINGDVVCFKVTPQYVGLLPRGAAQGGDGIARFCFEGGVDAKRAFAIPPKSKGCGFKGRAVVEIANYGVYTEEGDGHSAADLVGVLRKSPPIEFSCDQGSGFF